MAVLVAALPRIIIDLPIFTLIYARGVVDRFESSRMQFTSIFFKCGNCIVQVYGSVNDDIA